MSTFALTTDPRGARTAVDMSLTLDTGIHILAIDVDSREGLTERRVRAWLSKYRLDRYEAVLATVRAAERERKTGGSYSGRVTLGS